MSPTTSTNTTTRMNHQLTGTAELLGVAWTCEAVVVSVVDRRDKVVGKEVGVVWVVGRADVVGAAPVVGRADVVGAASVVGRADVVGAVSVVERTGIVVGEEVGLISQSGNSSVHATSEVILISANQNIPTFASLVLSSDVILMTNLSTRSWSKFVSLSIKSTKTCIPSTGYRKQK